MGKFLKILLTPTRSCVYSKWSACHGYHFEVRMLGYPPTPHPGSPAADPLTPKVWVNQGGGGGGVGSPFYNPQNGCTPLGVTHRLAAAPMTWTEAPESGKRGDKRDNQERRQSTAGAIHLTDKYTSSSHCTQKSDIRGRNRQSMYTARTKSCCGPRTTGNQSSNDAHNFSCNCSAHPLLH